MGTLPSLSLTDPERMAVQDFVEARPGDYALAISPPSGKIFPARALLDLLLEIEICRQMAIPGLKGDWGADDNCRRHVGSAICPRKLGRCPLSFNTCTLR